MSDQPKDSWLTDDRRERAIAFLDGLPEPEGSLEEVIQRAEDDAYEHMQAKWGQGAYRFGCPFCGASSRERCISDNTSEYMTIPHGERVRFAAAHDRSLG